MSDALSCDATEHSHDTRATFLNLDATSCQRAADIFRALGDPTRLRILSMLLAGEMCVSEIAESLDDNISAVSQRLKLLRSERVVAHRRQGKHIYYRLDDQHIAELISNALAHAREPEIMSRRDSLTMKSTAK